eukprot:sb/3474572/
MEDPIIPVSEEHHPLQRRPSRIPQRKSGSTQNLDNPRPLSATPTMRRPVSMGALPTSCPPAANKRNLLSSRSPPSRTPSTRGTAQPIIKQNTKKDDTKKIKSNVELKKLMKTTKLGVSQLPVPLRSPLRPLLKVCV